MKLTKTIALLVALGASASFVGCSASGVEAAIADVKPGPMPEGGDWTAEYYDQLVGTIVIIKKGDEVTGKWERPHHERWAEFNGKVDGNLLKFSWTEYKTDGIGPNN